MASLLHAGCIFAHAFKKYGVAVADAEKLKAENVELQLSNSQWNVRFDKLLTSAAKEKIELEKKLNTMGIHIGEVQVDLANRVAEIAELDGALKEHEEKAMHAQQYLAAKDEVLASKESELNSLRTELEAKEKELAEEKKKAIEAREPAVDAAYAHREEGFYLAKYQAQYLFPQ